MAFQIVAEKESEIVTMKRDSSLMAIAKARVWASEGWNVTIVVSDEDAPVLSGEYPKPLLALGLFSASAFPNVSLCDRD